MEQKNTTVERLEKELQGKIRAKKWVFFGGFATAISAFLELYSNPYDDSTYPYAQLLLAVVCFGYGVSLLYKQKKAGNSISCLAF
ncbi:hypothetical protein [Pectobacterium parmentieri]|uniref:Uncharacterized protein n=1 Tax=Pectobacterium parmentieri TaxID=1905730 RepID=A0A0H3I3P4_PECPM|nr:hypothetical protein [Pectobacterium parmentieri]AFI90657.1 Hypothetical protein W5S_2569 [Pectobacterium parmentieri]